MIKKFKFLILLLMVGGKVLFCQCGKYILYVQENNNVSNLILYDATTSETKLLTHFQDEGEIYSISTDESGLKIIFTRKSPSNGRPNSTIWMMNYEGSGLCDLIEGDTQIDFKYAAISPDGEKIAYCANSLSVPDSYQLYVMDIKTKISSQLTNFQPPVECSFPSFIDNETILFKVENKDDKLQDYYTVNIKGSDLTNLTNNSQFSPYFPKLGRPLLNLDRNKIIFGKQIWDEDERKYSNWEIYSYDLSSENEQLLIDNLYYGNIEPEDQLDPQPCFIEGGEIAFIGTQTGVSYNLYITNTSSGNPYLQRITYNINPFLPYYSEMPFLPTKWAYVDNQGKIYIKDETGTETFIAYGHNPSFDYRGINLAYSNNGIKIKRLPDGDETTIETDITADFPVFSPDGKWILYIKNNDIWGKPVDNSLSPTQLTNSPDIEKEDLVFSPDGKYILYTGRVDGKKYIYKLPVSITYQPVPLINSTGVPVNLTSQTYDNYQPTISEDGNTIVFISTRNQLPEIWKMDRNGNFQQKIIFTALPPENPSHPHFSPVNSNIIAYLSGSHPEYIYTADISSDTISGNVLPLSIKTSEKFSWVEAKNEIIDISRFIVYQNASPDIPFKYRINVNINKAIPNSLIVEETIPETWIVEEVKINDEVKTDSTITVENGKQTIKWLFGAAGICDVTDLIIQLKIDLNGDTTENEYTLTGSATDTDGKYLTYGDFFVRIDQPYIPVDTDENQKISDEELLNAIDLWATNSQIHGWPENPDEEWDLFLLDLIDFWAGNGYQYDSTESQNAGEPRWRKL